MTIITRTLVLSEAADEAQIARLTQAEGVVAIVPSPSRKRLKVTYDVRATVMAALEKVAVSLGLMPSQSLLARVGRAWAEFQDDNLRTQAKLQHHCCSTPPK